MIQREVLEQTKSREIVAAERGGGALRTYAGVTGDPTLDEYLAYLSVDGLVTGLKAAGPKPSQKTLIDTMDGITNYDGAGLFGSHSINWQIGQRGGAFAADNCLWFTQYSGSSFHVVPGADPICGTILAGQTA